MVAAARPSPLTSLVRPCSGYARRVAPAVTLRRYPAQHTASALAVYASCRHHRRRRKTRLRRWPIFHGWDSSLPTELCGEVSAFRPPLPLGLAWGCPYPLPYLTVVPLQSLQRYYGEVRERIGRGYGAAPVGWSAQVPSAVEVANLWGGMAGTGSTSCLMRLDAKKARKSGLVCKHLSLNDLRLV